MKKAAVINDLSGFGKCSLTAAIPVLSALGIQCVPLPTAVLTGQTEYEYYHCTDMTDMMPLYMDAWQKNNAHFDAIYSGFMTSPTQIRYTMDFIDKFYEDGTFLLVDPVMGDDGNVYDMYSDELLDTMKELSRRADLITPNLTEACLLADIDPKDFLANTRQDDLVPSVCKLGSRLREAAKNAQDVIITGVKCQTSTDSYICNLAFTGDKVHITRSHFYDRSFSGTGDLFASAMCGLMLGGMDTCDAVEQAQDFLNKAIEDTMREDIPACDGINFEKYLIELMNYGRHQE